MNTERSLFLCTNGEAVTRHTMDYGLWLAERLHMPVTLLGIIERAEQQGAVAQMLSAAEKHLSARGIPYKTLTLNGPLREIIIQQAHAGEHLVIFGPQGRPLWKRWVRGHVVRRLLPEVHAPVLYVPRQAQTSITRILLCTGALSHAHHAECWALRLAYHLQTALTILHVMEPVYYHYPTAEAVRLHPRNLLETDVPQARHLRELQAQASDLGLAVDIQLRQGTVIHEITHQARRGYDLVVMGSRHSAHSLRTLYQPDVTADVMETLPIPVLAVKTGQECLL